MNSDKFSITKCRGCNADVVYNDTIFSLEDQSISSYFPQNQEDIEKYPLDIICCDNCGLVQLRHTIPPEKLYTSFYGYRSGINEKMRGHLKECTEYCYSLLNIQRNPKILDIGCNDGTLLRYFEQHTSSLFGIDICANQFTKFYDHFNVIEGAFPQDIDQNHDFCNFDIITSLSMLYDIPDLNLFFSKISQLLNPINGVWIAEQSYLPSMLKTNSFDTIVHEHLEYYTIKPLLELASRHNLKIFDAKLNPCNGGSIRIAFANKDSLYSESETFKEYLKDDLDFNNDLKSNFSSLNDHLQNCISNFKELSFKNSTIAAIGASTKGNTFLQAIGATKESISFVTDRNNLKNGRYTPNTNIPIVSEDHLLSKMPDYAIVLPWHFREIIIEREHKYLEKGGKLVFFFPHFEILGMT